MATDLTKISARSWFLLARWTVLGTMGCVAVALAFHYFAFRGMGTEVQRQGVFTAIAIPVILAGPLFFYLTLKLRELAIVNHKLAIVASTDSLTACLNRGAFSTRVDERLLRAGGRKSDGSGALLIIDADHFKAINDRFGHSHGDEALRIIARSIRGSVRSGDLVGRLGGEEFGVFLPGAGEEAAADIAERIRSVIAGATFMPDGVHCPLSVSVGGAVYDSRIDFGELFRAADQRLYAAKAAGRNRVHLSGSVRTELRQALH
ncbi:MAG: GGDEF domain-containing protein [Pseudaminobacter sp.]|nr:GGDEF domain-containing protein [Pseudaminobacter sp.]